MTPSRAKRTTALLLRVTLAWLTLAVHPVTADDERTGLDFSQLLGQAEGVLSDIDTSRATGKFRGCGGPEAIEQVRSRFKRGITFGLGDTSDPDTPRTWSADTINPFTTVTVRWTRFSDATSAGKIFVKGRFERDCGGQPAGALKWAYVRFSIPVYTAGDGFQTGQPDAVNVETVCCGSFRQYHYVYDMKGFPLRMAGTDFPPQPPAAPKPKPAAPAASSAVSGGTGSAAATTATGRPATVSTYTPPPPPEPFTLENVCEPCEDEKVRVDSLRYQIGKHESERNQVRKTLTTKRGQMADLGRQIDHLRSQLRGQEGVGAESTDPATGITTKAYDDGSGTVVVTRHHPDGRTEEMDRYPRRSTTDLRRELTRREGDQRRLEKDIARLEKRQQDLEAALARKKGELEKALASLAACIDLCNRNIGVTSNYQTRYPAPPTEIAAAAAAVGQGAVAAGASLKQGARASTAETSTGTRSAGSEAPGTAQPPSADNQDPRDGYPRRDRIPRTEPKINPDLRGGLRYDWSWKTTLEPRLEYQFKAPFAHTELELEDTAETPPARVILTEQLFRRYRFHALPQLRILDPQSIPSDRGETLNTSPIIVKRTASNGPAGATLDFTDVVEQGAFRIIDGYGSMLEVGAFIGASWGFGKAFLGKSQALPPDFFRNVANDTLDILAEYEYWEDEPIFTAKEVGNAVFAAVITAGGSPREAASLARELSREWSLSGPVYMPLKIKLRLDGLGAREEETSVSPRLTGFAATTGLSDKTDDLFAGGPLGPWTVDALLVEANRDLRSYDSVTPNDPLYQSSGVLGEVGSALKKGLGAVLSMGGLGVGSGGDAASADDQWGLPAVGFTPRGTPGSAWDLHDGMQANVVVAVIDSGLDLEHPDRPRHIWRNPDEIPGNGIDDDHNGYVDDIHGWNFVAESADITDDYGHGTFVTGIIAANTNNGEGIAGINPGARIMVLKASDDRGSARDLAIYRALRYAVDNGARVINISLGNKGQSRLVQTGLNYAHAMGRLVVVAAGNEGAAIAGFTPQGSRRVIAVGSLNIDGTHRSSSNKGLNVALAAPGQSIYSLTATNGRRDGKMIPLMADNYHRLNGTSFAAPFVTGTAALIWAKQPGLTGKQVEDLLLSGAMEAEAPGWDPETGMGKLFATGSLLRQPETVFAPRITEVFVNRDRRGRVVSVDVYGIVRGPLESYTLEVGRGDDPDDWQPVFGPSRKVVDLGHITRIPESFFAKGSEWTLQLRARAAGGGLRVQRVRIRKNT